MAVFLRQSTAVDILIGPFVDEDDGKTLEESLTISQGDVMLSKNGQSLAQKNDNTACAFDDFGCYNCELDATDTNTLGELTVIVFEDGALPFRRDFQVIPAAQYDELVAGTVGIRIVKNTALAAFPFLMIDSADHISPKTGLTVTATRSLDGAAFAACANAVSEVSNGVYKISLAAADLNADTVMLKFTATGADARYILIVTQTV